jgi:hypothetical protein
MGRLVPADLNYLESETMKRIAIALLVLASFAAYIIFAPGSGPIDRATARKNLDSLLAEAREWHATKLQGKGDLAKKAELDDKLRKCGYVPSRFELWQARKTYKQLLDKYDTLEPAKEGNGALANPAEAIAMTLDIRVQKDRINTYQAAFSK